MKISRLYFLKKLIVAVLLFSPVWILAQDVDARSPAPRPSSKQEKKALIEKEKKKKAEQKGEILARKNHEKIQSKEVRKRMKKSKKKAKKWNSIQ